MKLADQSHWLKIVWKVTMQGRDNHVTLSYTIHEYYKLFCSYLSVLQRPNVTLSQRNLLSSGTHNYYTTRLNNLLKKNKSMAINILLMLVSKSLPCRTKVDCESIAIIGYMSVTSRDREPYLYILQKTSNCNGAVMTATITSIKQNVR